MRVEPFRVEHLQRMDVQDAQRYLLPYVNWDGVKQLENEWAKTVFDGERAVLCGGLAPVGGGRAVVWAYFSESAGVRMTWLVRGIKAFLKAAPFRRIEAFVDADFWAGHRLVRLLGFELETPRKRGYRIDGGDSSEYVLFR